MSTTLTVQPSDKDAWFTDAFPSNNYGTGTSNALYDRSANTRRQIYEFDLSGLPGGLAQEDITSATLSLYYYEYYFTNPSGKTVWAYKLTRTDWVENEATWDDYKSGSAWTSGGGDYVTSSPNGGSTTFPASAGDWIAFNVLDIVWDAYDSSNNAEFLVKFDTEGLASGYTALNTYSREYTGDTSLCPKLVIVYESGDVIVPGELATVDTSGAIPTLSIGSTVSSILATADAAGANPTIAINILIAGILATSDGAGLIPSLSIGSTAAPPQATVDVAGLIPAVGIGITISGALATADMEALSAVIGAGVGIVAALATADAEGALPTLSITAVVSAPAATADAEGYAITLSISSTVSAALATADMQAYAADIICYWIALVARARSLALDARERKLDLDAVSRSVSLTAKERE